MRKITEMAANAFHLGRAFSSGNTTVTVEGEDVCLALHGHTIARRRMYRGLTLEVSMCGWPTATTRERLRGVLPDFLAIGQTDGKQEWRAWGESRFVKHNGETVDSSATYRLNLEHGTIEVVS